MHFATISPKMETQPKDISCSQAKTLATAIISLGIIVRIATLTTPHAYFADEIFQYLEAAHHLAFGPAVVPWEYREHIRNWLVPLMLAGPMWAGGAIAPTSDLYLILPKLQLLVISLAAIPAAAVVGQRISTMHALFAMLAAATWYEFVYFSTVALTEPLAAILFFVAAALLYRQSGVTSWTLIIVGGLFALVAVIRFQNGPAVVLFAIVSTVCKPRQLGWMTVGALLLITGSAAFDLAMGERPFGWLFENVHQNITLGRAAATGIGGPFFYPQAIASTWGLWLAPLLVLAAVGAKRYPALMLAAIANILVHSAIAHKEYRYILLSTMLLTILAAIGTADVINWARQRAPGRWTQLPLIAAGGWIAASVSIAGNASVRHWWIQQEAPLRAFSMIRDRPDLCGVATFGYKWSSSGGYSYLHRAVPLFVYAPDQRSGLERDQAQFDTIVAPLNVPVANGFALQRCFVSADNLGACVFVRPGPCAAATSPAEINRQLILTDS